MNPHPLTSAVVQSFFIYVYLSGLNEFCPITPVAPSGSSFISPSGFTLSVNEPQLLERSGLNEPFLLQGGQWQRLPKTECNKHFLEQKKRSTYWNKPWQKPGWIYHTFKASLRLPLIDFMSLLLAEFIGWLQTYQKSRTDEHFAVLSQGTQNFVEKWLSKY